MENITLPKLKKLAKSYNAKVVINEFDSYSQSWKVEVEAPDGKQWSTCECQVLVAYIIKYEKGSRAEAYADLAERMSYGLEDYIE